MLLCEELKVEYLGELQELTNDLKEKSLKLAEEGSEDEAILEKIKVNVVDMFYKLFNVSYRKVYSSGEDSEQELLRKLSQEYFNFFYKIPEPWKEKMVKDKEFNMMEEYFKEEIKIKTSEQIKDIFIKHIDKYSQED
ncbi:hypothetical protein J2Z44_001944 [Clostridium punense]|uniref:Uncharacterized protein n=1 Tax=Clostridium punense TaxID=1054297 RepID=A0ABS4K2Z2_9CLOT|nr:MULTISPECIES: hypothetical protein [Clostridium]EQB89470.1 hypothetical protein M918_02870 [Clostridium sp. BL8]MBP2022143.1 hypothetical protein [Clostridium punense]